MRGSRQVRVAALTATILGAVIAAAPAVFAAIPKVDVYPSDWCIAGPWPAGTQVTYTLKDVSDVVKDTEVVNATEDGLAAACFDVAILPGDRIAVAQGLDARTLTVPALRIARVDRAPDRVKVVTKPSTTVTLDVHRCRLNTGFSIESCPRKLRRTATSSTSGVRTFDTTSSLDLRGHDLVAATIRNQYGDRFHADTYVPVFFINPGYAGVSGYFGARAFVEFTLLAKPGGQPIASAVLPSTAPYGEFNNGLNDVNVKSGNVVVGDFSPDGRMKVPPLVTSVAVASDTVNGRCFAGMPYVMITNAPSGGPFRGTAGAKGVITRTLPLNLTTDSAVSLTCMSLAGDGVAETFEVN